MKKQTIIILAVLVVIYIIYKNNKSVVPPIGDVNTLAPLGSTSIPTQEQYVAMKNAGLPDNVIFNRF